VLQFYADLDQHLDAYHRTIYVFCCKNGPCHKQPQKSFKVLRSQLPLCNKYYEENDPDSDDEQAISAEKLKYHVSLCELCGHHGDKRCSKCKKVYYCSKDHQKEDWGLGHDVECKLLEKEQQAPSKEKLEQHQKIAPIKRKSATLFDEYELVTEDEPDGEPESLNKEMELLKSYYNSIGKPALKVSSSELELDAVDPGYLDKDFINFQRIISKEKQQVIRYYGWVGAEPLWFQKVHKPTPEDIPKCQYCGANRMFEFQILPQLLYKLNVGCCVDAVDWGTLLIYTCENSCSCEEFGYLEEFIWRQPPL